MADASFKTVNVSISEGLIEASPFFIPGDASLEVGTPSITIRGSLLALRDAPPLILICAPEPGLPSPGVI